MLARVHQRPPPFVDCANSIWVSAGERSRTGVNETETETEGPSGPPRSSRAEERRPMSVEAISWALHLAPAGRGGQSPHRMQVRARRPSQPRRAGQHAPVLLRRWLAPMPVHRCHRCTAVTESKVTNLAGGHESRLPAEYLLVLFGVCGRVPRRRTASFGRRVGCRGVAMNSGFTVRAGDCLVWPAGLPRRPLIAVTSGVPFGRGGHRRCWCHPTGLEQRIGHPRIKRGPARSRRHGFRTVPPQAPARAVRLACPRCPDSGVLAG